MRRVRCCSRATRSSGARLLVLGACVLFARTAPAQTPTAAPVRGLGLVTRTDSLAELARLDSAVAHGEAPAATWHARGLLAWQLSQAGRTVGARVDREQLRLNQTADSSLVQAVTLDASNVRYLLDFATYRSQGSPFVRAGATRYIKRAFQTAREQGDSLTVAQMADKLGVLAFKEYQAMFGRRMSLNNGPGASLLDILSQQTAARSSWAGYPRVDEVGRLVADQARANSDRLFGSASTAESAVRELIESRSVPVGGDPPPGVLAFDEALEYFETATAAAPSLPLPWRHRLAALADRRRWEELLVAAQVRLAIAPWDPNAWLALGLARHRSGGNGALAAFDSAFAQMSDVTRARLDRVERIMRPNVVKTLDSLSSDERARTMQFVWTAADPLWSVPGNEVRAEFLARVAFAELRFTDEEAGWHGVDTFPGDLHVRYGFPKVTLNWSCAGAQSEADSPDSPNQVCWFWWYAPRLQFIVHYQPIFNRFRAGFDDAAITEEVQSEAPANWSNVPGVPPIDTIPLRAARFRRDATRPTLFVSASVPAQRMRLVDVRSEAPTARLWTIADSADAVARDSVRIAEDGVAQWKVRVPSGDVYLRAESMATGGGAARGTGFVSALPTTTGLAMSDVLVAATIAEPPTPARRWHELAIVPAPDTLSRTRGIALAWEVYGLGATTNAATYEVRLTLAKASKSVAGQIAAQIGGLVGLQRGNDRVTLAFERQPLTRDVSLDHVTLSLREAPTGRYTLSVDITDRASGAKVSRSTLLTIGR